MVGRPWHCKYYLQALYRTSRARGLLPHFARTPLARDSPSSGLLGLSSNSSVLSVFSVPFPAPAPQHLPTAFRCPRPWPFLPIPDSRSSTPGRMGFPPGTFPTCTHGVSSGLGRPCSPPPCLRDRSGRSAPRSHTPTLHGRPRSPIPDSRSPNAWGFLRPQPSRLSPLTSPHPEDDSPPFPLSAVTLSSVSVVDRSASRCYPSFDFCRRHGGGDGQTGPQPAD
jgi:hypothetical protein